VSTPDRGALATAVMALTVVRGKPTPEQLAALVAVVTARAVGVAAAADASYAADDPRHGSPPLWAVPALRTPLAHGPGAWRAGGLPR